MNRLTFLSVEIDRWDEGVVKQVVDLIGRAMTGAVLVSAPCETPAGDDGDNPSAASPPQMPAAVDRDPAPGRRGRPRTAARNWRREDVPQGLARQREGVKPDCPPAWRDPERTNKDRCLAALEKGTWLSTREIADKTGLDSKQVQNVFNVTAKPSEYAKRMSDSGIQFAPVGTSPGF